MIRGAKGDKKETTKSKEHDKHGGRKEGENEGRDHMKGDNSKREGTRRGRKENMTREDYMTSKENAREPRKECIFVLLPRERFFVVPYRSVYVHRDENETVKRGGI